MLIQIKISAESKMPKGILKLLQKKFPNAPFLQLESQGQHMPGQAVFRLYSITQHIHPRDRDRHAKNTDNYIASSQEFCGKGKSKSL